MKKLAYLNLLPITNQKNKKMKKISLFLLMSIATLMFVSCKKESTPVTPTDAREKATAIIAVCQRLKFFMFCYGLRLFKNACSSSSHFT